MKSFVRLHFYFALSCLLSLACSTKWDNEVELGPLGIRLDLTLPERDDRGNVRTERPQPHVFHTRLIFKELVADTITDDDLTQIAINAYNEMVELFRGEKYDLGKRSKPTVMTALAFDREIILSSSLRGPGFIYNHGAVPVTEALQRCRLAEGDLRPHKNDGKCGEPLAAHLYYCVDRQGRLLPEEGARVTTVQVRAADSRVAPVAPCPDNSSNTHVDAWGCATFVRDQNWKLLSLVLEGSLVDPMTLAGGYEVEVLRACAAARGLPGHPGRLQISDVLQSI